MQRRQFFAFVLAAFSAFVAPTLVPQRAEAVPAAHNHRRVYYIYYRQSTRHPWRYYGATTNPTTAAYYVHALRYHYRVEAFYR